MAKDKNIEIPQEIFEIMGAYIEALLFASDEPIPVKSLSEILTEFFSSGKNGAIDPAYLTNEALRSVISILNERYKDRGQSFHIIEIAGGFQFATLPKFAKCLGILFKEKSKRRLSQSALETLAIIVFKQPISKPDIENIRGVNSDYVLSTLLEKDLVAIVGRADTVGRPLLYGTTQQFLKHFGLKDTKDLPKLKEVEEIMNSEEFKFEVKRLEESLNKGTENEEESDEPEINPENIPADMAVPVPSQETTEAEKSPEVSLDPEPSENTNETSVETETAEVEDTVDVESAPEEITKTEDENIEPYLESEEEQETESYEEIANESDDAIVAEPDEEIETDSNIKIETDLETEKELGFKAEELDSSREKIEEHEPADESQPDISIDISEEEISGADIESSDSDDDVKKKSSNIESAEEDFFAGAGASAFRLEDADETKFPPFIVEPEIMPPIGADLLEQITTELSENKSFVAFQGGDEKEEKSDSSERESDEEPDEDFFFAASIEESAEVTEHDDETLIVSDESEKEEITEDKTALIDNPVVEYFEEGIPADDDSLAAESGIVSDIDVFNRSETITEAVSQEGDESDQPKTEEIPNSIEDDFIDVVDIEESLPEEAEYTTEQEINAEIESLEELEEVDSIEGKSAETVEEEISDVKIEESSPEEAEYTTEQEINAESESVEELEQIDGDEVKESEEETSEDVKIEESSPEEAEYTTEQEINAESESVDKLGKLEDEEVEEDLIQSDADVIHDYSGYELESSPIMAFRNLDFDDLAQTEPENPVEFKPIRDSIEPDYIYKKRRRNLNALVLDKLTLSKVEKEPEEVLPVIEEKLIAASLPQDLEESKESFQESIDLHETEIEIAAEKENLLAEDAIDTDNIISIKNEKLIELTDTVFSPENITADETLFDLAGDIEKETDIEDDFEIKAAESSEIIQKVDALLQNEFFVPQKKEFDDILSAKYLHQTIKRDSSFAEIESILTKDKYLDFSDKKNEIYQKLNTIYTGKMSSDLGKDVSDEKKRRVRPTERIRMLIKKVWNLFKKLFTGRL